MASERIYSGRVVNVRVDTVAVAGGKHHKREIVEHRGSVAIVPMHDDGTVVLVRQFRKAAGRFTLEIPAGTLEPGEDPSRCAARELQEETGFRATVLAALAKFFVSPGYSTELMHLFLAKGLQSGVQGTEEDEQIRVLEVPIAEALQMVDRGEIVDAKTIIGLLMARDRKSDVSFV